VRAGRLAADAQEGREKLGAGGGEDRLGMELHAQARELAVAHDHGHSVGGRAFERERGGPRFAPRGERVVAADDQRIGQSREPARGAVPDLARSAVYGSRVGVDDAAVVLAQHLMTEADAEDGELRGSLRQQRVAQPCVARLAGTGAEHETAGAERKHGRCIESVVAHDPHLDSARLHRLGEVEGEGIVVVDQDDHGSARSRRERTIACAPMPALHFRTLATVFALFPLCASCGEDAQDRGLFERAGEKLDRAAERLGDEFDQLVEDSDRAIERARQRFDERDQSVADDIDSALEKLGREFERGREKVGAKASEAREKLEREFEEHMQRARESVKELRRASKDDWQRVLDDIRNEAREAGERLRESAGK